MKSFSDRLIEIYNRDPFEKANEELAGGAIVMVIINVLLLMAPCPVRLFAIVWPAWGLATLYWRLDLEAKAYGTDKWTEFLIGWKLWTELIATVYFWPVSVLFVIFGDTKNHSFRSQVESVHIQDLFRKCGPKDHARESALRIFQYGVKQATQQSKAIQEMPEQLVVSAKTASVCGATVMTMATSAASAAGPAPATATNSMSVSASGWVTVVGDIPDRGKPELSLEYARAFVTVADSAFHTSLFTEIDADALQYRNPDVLKRYFLTFDLGDKTSLSVGRMFVAGGWMLPGPTALETVDYPRYPFTFQGYAVQADAVRGSWHFLADVSGTTGLSFMDRGQFDTVETSAHLSRSFGSAYAAALTWQISERFYRVSIDAKACPFVWIDTRGMVYYDREIPQGGTTKTSIGAYGYVGIRPIPGLPGLSLHGQADCHERLDGRETEPLILTGGLRMQFYGDKYSVIMDYRAGFGSRQAAASDGARLCFQAKF